MNNREIDKALSECRRNYANWIIDLCPEISEWQVLMLVDEFAKKCKKIYDKYYTHTLNRNVN